MTKRVCKEGVCVRVFREQEDVKGKEERQRQRDRERGEREIRRTKHSVGQVSVKNPALQSGTKSFIFNESERMQERGRQRVLTFT